MSLLADVIGYGTHAARPAAGSAGRLYYESDTDSLWRDNGTVWDALSLGGSSASPPPTVRAYSAAVITVPDSTNMPVPLDTTDYDRNVPGGALQHDPATNPERLTCHVAGTYAISVFAGFASDATGLRYVSVRKNGSGLTFFMEDGRAALVGDVTEFALATQQHLAVGDYVEMLVWQGSGGSLPLRSTNGLTPSLAWTLVAS